jgi:hypothetical protein
VCVGIVAAIAFGASACDDANDQADEAVDDAREQAEDAAGSAGARAQAEAMRVALQAKSLPADQTVRDVGVLQDAADSLPGDVTVSGLSDADGDGKDDDGKIQFTVGDQHACVTVADNGEISVSGDAC